MFGNVKLAEFERVTRELKADVLGIRALADGSRTTQSAINKLVSEAIDREVARCRARHLGSTIALVVLLNRIAIEALGEDKANALIRACVEGTRAAIDPDADADADAEQEAGSRLVYDFMLALRSS